MFYFSTFTQYYIKLILTTKNDIFTEELNQGILSTVGLVEAQRELTPSQVARPQT